MAVTATIVPTPAPAGAPLLLPAAATAADIDTALENAVYPFGAGSMSVIRTGAAGAYTWTVTFAASLGRVNLLRPVLVGVAAGATMRVQEAVAGITGVRSSVQVITQAGMLTGNFWLAYPTIASKPPEAVLALAWVDARLKADSVLSALIADQIHGDKLPATPAGMSVLYTAQSNSDDLTVSGERTMSSFAVKIEAVGRVKDYSDPTLKATAQRIEELFGGVYNETVTDGWIIESYREMEIVAPESLSDGSLVLHLGGIYRIGVQVI